MPTHTPIIHSLTFLVSHSRPYGHCWALIHPAAQDWHSIFTQVQKTQLPPHKSANQILEILMRAARKTEQGHLVETKGDSLA